jgi:OOP family OmpA-OmpF porin
MNISRSVIALLGAALTAWAAPATAQFYVGGGIGQSNATQFCSSPTLGGGVIGCDQKDIALRGFAGYQFNDHLAFELGYHNFGKPTTAAPASVRMSAWEGLLVGSVPIGPLALLGKFGLYRGEGKGAGGGFTGIREQHTTYTFGAGLQYDLSKQFALRGEWMHYPNMLGGAFGGQTDVNTLSAGALYRF